MSNLSELLPTGGGQNVVDFVANGTLPNGAAVGLKSDGTIEAIAQTNNVETLGTAASSGSTNKQRIVASFDPSENLFLVAYSDYNNNYGYLITASVSGSTLTFNSTPYAYYSGTIDTNVGLAYVPTDQRTCLVYENVNGRGRAGMVSINSSGVPFLNGSYQMPEYIYAIRYDVCYDATSGNLFFAYTEGSGDLIGVVGSISGNVISYGTEVIKANTRVSRYVRCVATTGSQIAVVYDKGTAPSGSGTTYATIATISGTSFTWGTSDVLIMPGGTDSWDFVYDTTASKLVFLGTDAGNSYYPSYRVGTISGTGTGASVSWSTTTVVESGTRYQERIGYIPASNSYAVWYKTASNTYQVLGATLSGTTLTFPLAAKVMVNFPTNTFHVGIAVDTTQINVAAFAVNLAGAGNSSRLMYGASFSPAYTSTNVSSFIGITAEAISNAATGPVNVYGGINTAQTGLTIASDYYVQEGGTLSTASASPAIKVGQAVSATTINMKDLT